MSEQDIFEPFKRYGKPAKAAHSREFLAILEQASPNTAIRAITHAKPLLVFWITPEGSLLDAGNAHFDNPPKGDKSVLSHSTNKGHLRGRSALIGGVLYIVVYGDQKDHSLSQSQLQLLKRSYSRILEALRGKGVADNILATVQFIQENGEDILI